MNVEILAETKTNFSEYIVVRYIVAVIAACTGEAVTYPVDLAKTRLQVQNELATAKHGFKMEHRGMIGTIIHVGRTEGVHKLWSGLPATWHRHTVYAGCRLVFYERLRQFMIDHNIEMNVATTVFCSTLAGGGAQFFASPADLAKVKMQAKGRAKKAEFTGTMSVYKMVYKQSGVFGFWRGAIPNVLRAALSGIGSIGAYDYTKSYLKQNFNMPDNVILHGSSAVVAGLFAALLGTPADVLKSRLMNQPVGPDGKGAIYKGVIDCLRLSIRNEGFLSLYKGFVPVWMRIAPWTMVNWLTFETIMLQIGVSGEREDFRMSNLVLKEIDKPTTKFTDWIITRYIVAVLGAWCAELATYPFDLAKTRLQIQNELASAKHGYKMEHHGMISTAIGIVRKEGPFHLFSGLTPMCQRHVLYAGSRLVFYEKLRRIFKDERGRMTLGTTIICGATCGALAQLIASPADLVKVQMQAEGRRRLQGMPKRFDGCWQVYKMIYRDSGIIGFWRGAIPNMQRAAFVNIGDLAAYDYAKRFFLTHLQIPDNIILHVLSGFTAGLVAAVLGTPADVLKTRQMNQPVGPDGKGAMYRGMIDCFRQSVGNEGFFSLYKGFTPMWVRLGPWALVNWVAFEQIIQLIGGKTF